MNTVEALKHLFLDAGAGWVLWLLAGLSVASLAIALERWAVYRRAAGDLHALAGSLQQRLARDDGVSVAAWLDASGSVPARVAAAGLRLGPRGPAVAAKAMASRTALEREDLDERLAFLGTLGNNAPFIGLLGTVIGVIQAFEELGHSASGHASARAATQVASGAVMSAIAEALVATALGIAVALPAVAAYNYLQRRVEHVLAGADVLSNLVLAYLEGGALPERPGRPGDGREPEPSAGLVPAASRS
ncbi:MAG: MotA/TolQ/ExbB proton channel family protein [Myxococcales bacterium]|nr:MotA/TolQ/ExbB proton channel family protein [Myxococcales bacterium]MDD9971383.1 MotA/TolQ/ExbB proton channel family protein [Myxococcales bacterium]